MSSEDKKPDDNYKRQNAEVDDREHQSYQEMKSAEETKKLIDFHGEIKKYQRRTQKELPYTIQQTEDAIFIDERRLVALEYIFYTKDNGRYHRLK